MSTPQQGTRSVVGIYTSCATADAAVRELLTHGVSSDAIVRLASADAGTEAIPTTDAEQPGMGTALGGVVGLSGGLFAASLLVPGLGAVSALGAAAATFLGLGGTVAGAAIGHEIESSLDTGIPRDELFVYEDALRQGRAVVVVNATSEVEAAEARGVLTESGAETIDAAREQWWIGLRDADNEHYAGASGDVVTAESVYRRGFEAAMRSATERKSMDANAAELRHDSSDAASEVSFRRGFQRGKAYLESWNQQRSAGARDAPEGTALPEHATRCSTASGSVV
jgi:hypothetical protein